MTDTRDHAPGDSGARARARAVALALRGNRRVLASRVRSVKNGQARVLELGCGHMDFTARYLRPACREVVATDVEPLFPPTSSCPRACDSRLKTHSTCRSRTSLSIAPSHSRSSSTSLTTTGFIHRRTPRPPSGRKAHRDDAQPLAPDGAGALPGGEADSVSAHLCRRSGSRRHHARRRIIGDLIALVDRHRDLAADADVEGIGLGVPAWGLLVHRAGPLHMIAFDWHLTLQRRSRSTGTTLSYTQSSRNRSGSPTP